MGRPAFKPTIEHRKMVESMAGIGITQADILNCVPWGRDKPIDEKTLRKHFGRELERGKSVARMRLAKRVYELALEGDRTMLIFWMKCQAGWKETMTIEQTGPDGAPLPQAAQVVCYLPTKDPPPDRFGSVIESSAAPPLPAVGSTGPVPSAIEADAPNQAVGAVRPGTMFPKGADPRL